MEDLNIIGPILSVLLFLAGWFIARFYFTRKKKWNEKIQELENHLEYVKKVRKSSVEMNREAFRFLFLVLLCISLGLFIPSFAEYATLFLKIDPKYISVVAIPLKSIFLMVAIMVAFIEFRNFNDIIHYQKAVERINRNLEKLKKKVENV